ncbi:CHASE domain-containing protein [Sulfitobacter sp. F26204]|uniref:CHASE domain-containing protein n=1 Tax=Sulfitobacter sp. F26204 TaxID=2996014 RepID=UPI00225E4C0E|nr:CHASE domain-containing protein [Sulfitobacter sp. F26204]MCX7560208.1 CHASE domain-containing protein [Sulfitobacter sp. F26204]
MTSRLEIFVVLVCVILTSSLYGSSEKTRAEVADSEFQRLAEDGVQVLRTRMMTYLQSVKGIAAFVSASDEVRSNDFETYISSLETQQQLPSITGFGLVVEVPDAELDGFVELVRADGQPDFTLRHRTSQETHFILKYIEPRATNAQALGLDLSFNADRVNVLEKARKTGQPQMTPPVQLVQENRERPGFIVLAPIISKQDGPRQSEGFVGWVSAVFIAENLIDGLTAGQGSNYEIQVFDGATAQEGQSIFDGRKDPATTGAYSATYQMEQFGRTWTLVFNSTKSFDTSLRSYQSLTVLIAGLTLTGFLILVLRNFQQRSRSLNELAALRARQIAAQGEENRSIIENEVTSVLLLDASENIKFANQAALKCFGYSETEIVKLQFSSVAHRVKDTTEGHNAIGYHKDSSVLELDLQRNDWVDSAGRTSTTVILRDLTDQNTAQRELKHNKALYDMALQGAEIGVFDIDLITGLSEVSETWCQIMGYAACCNGMNTQQDFLSRIHPEDIEKLRSADNDCIAGRTERSITEYRLKTMDGNWCWMRSDAVIVERDETGKALRMIGTQTDVTALRRDKNALEASEQLFRQVLSNAPIGMVLMNDRGKFIGVNDAFCQLVGCPEEKLIGKGQFAEWMPDDDRRKIYASIARMMDEKTSSVYTAEHRILNNMGNERWGLVNVTWSFDKNEGRNIFIAQIIDITEQKRLDLIKDEFVATVSHELRTPLTSIKGALGLLTASKDANLSKGNARLVEIANSNAERLTDIVNDILDLGKISSGKVLFDIGDVDLAEVMETAVQEMLPFALTHESTMRLDVPAALPPVLVDPRRTKQVLANLISNACKYSYPDSEVVVRAERLDDVVIVYIQNTGPGVPNEFRSRIFQAFSQADSSDTRTKGGTGLGLNITRQIVLRQGGKIGFESKPNGITVFWFTVPLAETDMQQEITPVLTRPPEVAKPTVLHVEDDHDFAEVISGALNEVACVTHAKSIATAKSILHRKRLDVVILDWTLPDGNAETLLDDILSLQPQARIIALSADAERAFDPRLFSNMVKSRTDIATIVASVCDSQPLAS